MSKTFLCKFMPRSEGMQFIFYSGVVCVCVRYPWGLVSSLVDKRASYGVNIYSNILIVVTQICHLLLENLFFYRVVQNENCIYSRLYLSMLFFKVSIFCLSGNSKP